MENKIHKRFLDEASRIRQSYLSEIKNFQSKEDDLKIYQNRLTEILDNITDYVKSHPDISEEQITVELKDELTDIETNMNIIKEEVAKLDTNIKKLRKQSSTLFHAIKAKHTDLTDEEIHKEILYYIKE